MARAPQSISVRQVSAAAQASVAKVIKDSNLKLPKPPYIIGFIPPWWCGIIWRDPIVDQLTLGTARKVATDVHRGIAAEVPAAKAGTPGVFIHDGLTTVGFLPPIDINAIQE
jgi:hypothetical protein